MPNKDDTQTEDLPKTEKSESKEVSSLDNAIKSLPKDPEKTATEWFQTIQGLADKLTLSKIIITLLAGIMFIFVVVLYEYRNDIFDASITSIREDTEEVKWTPSDETKQDLTALVSSSSLIKSSSITNINLQKNRQIVSWFYLNDPIEPQIRNKVSKLLAQPVFDYDPKNTQQMVAVLNNEFTCVPYKDTGSSRLFPELNDKIASICRIAIPPFYGRFAGILTLGLNAVPTKFEEDSLRLETSRIAVEIYVRDVTKPNSKK